MTDKCPADEWTREVPLSPEKLAMFREERVAIENKLGRAPDKFTCDECARAPVCHLAFDSYNTDGDCLWEK